MKTKSKKLVILTNVIAPSRIAIYDYLSKHFDLSVLVSGDESNRTYWKKYLEENITFSCKKVAGLIFKYSNYRGGKKFKKKFLHINPGYLFELIKIRPQYVISVEMGFRSFQALLYCFLARKPLWIWWGGTLYTEKNISVVKKVIRKLFLSYPKWISYGGTSTEYLLSLGIIKDKILQIQNTIDERNIIKATSSLQIRLPGPIILFVGELIERKGLPLLLESIQRLKTKGLYFSLIVVGEGPERKVYEEYSHKLNLENVSFVGSCDPMQIFEYYKAADFMVFPSLFDVWGTVVNEALWSDLPIISSKYAGASSDLLPDEYIFDPLDEKSFDSAMNLMNNKYSEFVDKSRLIPISEVSKMIKEEIDK